MLGMTGRLNNNKEEILTIPSADEGVRPLERLDADAGKAESHGRSGRCFLSFVCR